MHNENTQTTSTTSKILLISSNETDEMYYWFPPDITQKQISKTWIKQQRIKIM